MNLIEWGKKVFGVAKTQSSNPVGLDSTKSRSNPIELDSSGKAWFWEAGFVAGYNFSSYSMREFVLNGYASNPFVFMCADKIAQVSAQLDWQIMDEKTKKPVNDSNIDELFLKPNSTQTWDDFYYELIVSLQVTGNAFIRKEKAVGFSKTTSMTVLVPYLVDIVTIGGYKDSPILYYTYDGTPIDEEEILHIKYANIVERTHWGFSKLQPGIKVYEASNNIFEAEAHLHKNLGITGVLSNKDSNMPMSPKEQKALQDGYDSRFAGPKKFGKIMVTTASLEYLKLGMSPEDLQTLEGQIAKMRFICALFGLDSSLFNDPENKTFANRTMAEVSMYETVIKPLTEKVNRALSASIIQKEFGKQNAVIVSDFENVACLAEAKSQMNLSIREDVKAGIITPEEARQFLYPQMETVESQKQGDIIDSNSQAQQANAEAQANLRGSVGGVQGILSIQSSVQQGITTVDSAITILVNIYGFDEETARQILK